MKVKTSVNISKEMHRKLKAIAKAQDRSVSYVLERFIRDCVKTIEAQRRAGMKDKRGNGGLVPPIDSLKGPQK
jgi:predicted transcriptional regulator